MKNHSTLSPLVSSDLLAAVQSGEIKETDFWVQIEALGTPLIENDTITFLWHGDETTENVALFGTLWMDPKQSLFTRIPNTHIWFRKEVLAKDMRGVYFFSLDPPIETPLDKTTFPNLFKTWIEDPLNRDQYYLSSMNKSFSVFAMPDATREPWMHEEVPEGRLIPHTFTSRLLDNERSVHIYLPKGYTESAAPYPIAFFFDGEAYAKLMSTQRILDYAIHHEILPPVVGVFVGNVSETSRFKELPCNPDFSKFLSSELLPFVRSHYHVTNDPKNTLLVGSSYGGLAACYAALLYPQSFGKVLSQSGSYWWEHERLHEMFKEGPKQNIDFSLSVGKYETHRLDPDYPDMVSTNRRFASLLEEKGYQVAYEEYSGGHDYRSWRATLLKSLKALFEDG